MPKKFEIRNSTADFLIFQIEGKEDGVQVVYRDETVWCTQKAMAQLFDCSTDNIGLHLKNIYKTGELPQEATTENFSVVQRTSSKTMDDYATLIDKILGLTDNAVLQGAGKITAEFSKSFAESEFEKYRVIQDKLFQSDFDRFNDDNLIPLDIE